MFWYIIVQACIVQIHMPTDTHVCITLLLTLLVWCNLEPTGKSDKDGQPAITDSAFEGFLKQVECMHAQGKASFGAEFNVSQVGL